MVKDVEAQSQLIDTVLNLINDNGKLKELSDNVLKLAQKDSADRIADIILNEIKK
jgi:UDP-N-acetylglucosamine--N-acetylmuramyl-(pentapeptide) pyrophosphoryl-undecaprenol N-acetylglucosamine transferase